MIVECSVVLGHDGGHGRRDAGYFDHIAEIPGVLSVDADVSALTGESTGRVRTIVTVSATTPDAVRRVFAECEGLPADDPAWADIERQLAKYKT